MKKLPKGTRLEEIEAKLGVPIEEELRRKFVDEDKSIDQISKEIGISYVTTLRWLKLAGVRSRKIHL